MSSDFYPSSLSRNLIRTGAFAYRENVALGILDCATDTARNPGNLSEAIGSFVAFPDFSGEAQTRRGTHRRRVYAAGQLPLSTLAAFLDERSGPGPRPL